MNRRVTILTYAGAIFLGAFLLFQVQPLIGKYVLPWFGGAPEVWTTCMLFFQTLLLVGYVYAHLSVRLLRPRWSAALHVVLLLGALLVLPIVPNAAWAPTGAENPTLRILLLLAATIGVPYFVLASTSPLMQSWFSRSHQGATPYRFYALSNAGSMLALLSYPFIVEPFLPRSQQVIMWSGSLIAFAVISVLCAANLWRRSGGDLLQPQAESATKSPTKPATSLPPTIGTRLLWLVLPGGASVVLLAVTNKICLDIAAIPFLWIVPLSLYLLSFIICFDNQRWYVRKVFVAVFIICIIAVIYLRMEESRIDKPPMKLLWQLIAYLTAMFMCCMVCHGELFRLRPAPARLTGYYLTIAAGGAIGGFFVAVIAPLIFNTYIELYVGLLACCIFALLADPTPAVRKRRWVWVTVGIAGMAAVGFIPARNYSGATVVTRSRNFYGVLTLWEKYPDNPHRRRYLLQHGTTFHGVQFADPNRAGIPTAYYGLNSGGGLAATHYPREGELRMGVVGLGAGTMAAYGWPDDTIRFYEINPEVLRMAESRFTFLRDSAASVDVVMGDARLSLQNQPPQEFDILVLDAFSSDAIPVHLLTVEAFEIYLKHLKDHGVIAIHVTNHHLDLRGMMLQMGQRFGLKGAWIRDRGNEAEAQAYSSWILLTSNEEFLRSQFIKTATRRLEPGAIRPRLWTDDHVSLLEVLQ